MSERSETSADEDGEQRVTVRRLVPSLGITAGQIVRAVDAALGDRPVRAISVAVVDEATISSLNARYLGESDATDVLAFDLRDDREDDRVEGEIVISAEAAAGQAVRLGVDPGEELLRYVIHGMLHLMGYDDQAPGDRRRMKRAEDRILARLDRRPRLRERRHRQGRATRGG